MKGAKMPSGKAKETPKEEKKESRIEKKVKTAMGNVKSPYKK